MYIWYDIIFEKIHTISCHYILTNIGIIKKKYSLGLEPPIAECSWKCKNAFDWSICFNILWPNEKIVISGDASSFRLGVALYQEETSKLNASRTLTETARKHKPLIRNEHKIKEGIKPQMWNVTFTKIELLYQMWWEKKC